MRLDRVIPGRGSISVLATNVTLRNTYILLGLTLSFSALMAGLALVTQAPMMNPLIYLVGYVGLLSLTQYFRNSSVGLICIFALTGFLGYWLGPFVNLYLKVAGSQLVMMSLGSTGLIFFALSAYTLVTQKNFQIMSGFLLVGFLVALLMSVGAFLFHIPALTLAVAAMIILLSSGVILVQTSQIIHSGETNYITATINLYLSLFNIFFYLLMLGSSFSKRE